jgi:hypothetical protein
MFRTYFPFLELTLGVYNNKFTRRIFGPKRKEELQKDGESSTLRSCILHFFSHFIREINIRWMSTQGMHYA